MVSGLVSGHFVFTEYFAFSFSVSFHQSSPVIRSYMTDVVYSYFH